MAMKKDYTLRELRDTLSNAYCQKIGVEYMHIPSRDQCNWIRDKIETRQFHPTSNEMKIKLLERILYADGFNEFIGNKFNTLKRFGLEGCDSFIPGMKSCNDTLQALGAEKVVVGMPHRGRLSFLANVVRKPLDIIFAEF
jgi:2-oxoglutarate dehydrogenase E1 component